MLLSYHMPKAIRFDTSDACGPWTWTWTCPQNQFYRARSATFSPSKCRKWKIVSTTIPLYSSRFGSVPFCVPFFVCCSLGNSEKKTEMHLFIAGQHAMQACRAARQPGKLTYIEFREHSELLIITYIANRQTDRHTYIYVLVHVWPHARTSQNSVWFMLIDKFTH